MNRLKSIYLYIKNIFLYFLCSNKNYKENNNTNKEYLEYINQDNSNFNSDSESDSDYEYF